MRRTPSTFVCRTRVSSSSFESVNGYRPRASPALLKRMSTPPRPLTQASTKARLLASSVTSSASAISASTRSTRRAPPATRTPASRSLRVVAAPIPDEAPVTIAVLPRRSTVRAYWTITDGRSTSFGGCEAQPGADDEGRHEPERPPCPDHRRPLRADRPRRARSAARRRGRPAARAHRRGARSCRRGERRRRLRPAAPRAGAPGRHRSGHRPSQPRSLHGRPHAGRSPPRRATTSRSR